MKWYRNKQMLQDILNQYKKRDSLQAKDMVNLILDHLVLLDENEKLKKIIDIFKTFISVSSEVNFDTFITSYCDDDVFDLLREVINNE